MSPVFEKAQLESLSRLCPMDVRALLHIVSDPDTTVFRSCGATPEPVVAMPSAVPPVLLAMVTVCPMFPHTPKSVAVQDLATYCNEDGSTSVMSESTLAPSPLFLRSIE